MKMTKLAKMSLLALAAVILAVPAAASYYRSPCNRRTCNQNHNKVKASTMLQESLLDNFHDFFYSYAGFPTSSSLAYDQIDRKSPLSSYSYAVKQDDESMTLQVTLPGHSRDSVKLTLKTTEDPNLSSPYSSISIASKTQAFEPTTFKIDKTVDVKTIESSMADGVLTIKASKLQPVVEEIDLKIEAKAPSQEAKEVLTEEKTEKAKSASSVDPPSPGDSVGIEITTDND